MSTPKRSPQWDQIEAEAARLLARKDRLGDRWSAENDAQLQAWLALDVAHRVAWLRLLEGWQRADALAEIASPLPSLKRRSSWAVPAWMSRRPAVGLAATLLAFLVPLVVLLTRGDSPHPEAGPNAAAHSTGPAMRRSMTLPDGSQVTLNAHTRVRTKLSPTQRQAWLEEGEAYFDVQRDPTRPFIVHAGNDQVVVLGTRFSVRRTGNLTQVLVQEGRVRVEQAGQPRIVRPTMLLTAGAEAALTSDSVLVQQHTPTQVMQALDWRHGRLTFQDRALGDVATELNRFHARQLIVDPSVSDMRISGSFDIENLDGFVRLMHDGFGVSVHTEADELHLGSR